MSTRFYQRYVLGNPQLRIFLPDFWIILTKNRSPYDVANNRVTFKVHPRMTEYDVKNYLEKIYKIPVANISSTVRAGKYPMAKGANFLTHEPDYRLCFVTLPQDWKFTHPDTDLFLKDGKSPDKEEHERNTRQMDEVKKKVEEKNEGREGIPSWFSI